MGVDLSQRAAFGNPLGIDVLNNELSWLLGPFGSLVGDTITNIKDDIKNSSEDDTERAVLTAIEMQNQIKYINT